MLRPKEFLEQQFDLLDEEIKEALRHEYGPAESGLFFVECQDRLASLRLLSDSLTATPSTNQLKELVSKLSRLAALINRIQHSRIGEFPWAFAEELRRLATDLCKSNTGSAPLFFFSSKGRLDAYAVHDEQENVDVFDTPIFNVVFPRTLKHQVLIHPVLGHEIVHALLSMPKLKSLQRDVEKALFKTGPLVNAAAFRNWLSRSRSTWAKYSDSDLDYIASRWREELSCDLLGLLIMGPSFTPALFSTLGALNPDTVEMSHEHPPPVCRFFAQRVAIRSLRWVGNRRRRNAAAAERSLWRGMERFARQRGADSLVPASSIKAAIHTLKQQLTESSALFDARMLGPVDGLLQQILNLVPPVGDQKIERDIPATEIDFRAIVYAGWLACELRRGMSGHPNVDEVNRLCELAIVQQRGITCIREWSTQPGSKT